MGEMICIMTNRHGKIIDKVVLLLHRFQFFCLTTETDQFNWRPVLNTTNCLTIWGLVGIDT